MDRSRSGLLTHIFGPNACWFKELLNLRCFWLEEDPMGLKGHSEHSLPKRAGSANR